MSTELLDSPIGRRTIRKPYFSFLEYAIMIFNGLFIFIGIGISWNAVFKGGSWIFLVNPPCFILFFGLTPLLYIKSWRKKSLEYETTNDVSIFKDSKAALMDFLNTTLLVIWSLILVGLLAILGGLFSAIGDEPPYFVVFMFTFLSPFLILGPGQFFFIRMTRKIQKEISALNEE